ncbi:MAG: hypothetical protein KDI79_23145 [Anaerolineae bacterium]|nr:hypothetical protein [Anaerolineae bacterium]
MQINWTLLTYLIIIYFAVAGFSRGWWREAITTVFLAVLVFLLQNPDWAQTIIDTINSWIAAIWSYIPTGITDVVNNGLTNFFAVTTRTDNPFQLDPSAPETWFFILIIFMVLSAIIGGLGFRHQPTGFGRLLGIGMGALNGYLLLSIAREYLDGRALPGGEVAAASEVSLVGGSSFGQAASSVSIQAVNLPNITVMDSIIPWLVIGLGLLFLFAIVNTRFRFLTSNEGRKIETQRPPFYR